MQNSERAERLVPIRAVCPKCGARPALRLTERIIRLLTSLSVKGRLGTYQCHRRGCGAIYDLPADLPPTE